MFALYENLPEEGGKKNTTGGKQEESVLKSIKSMLDVVCLHLSDPLFDLVLNQVYNYATLNAKSNSVRAFGQLVACLARVRPEKVIKKFLPFCKRMIEEELKHGASSIRTTSQHSAVPSDTTLHWSKALFLHDKLSLTLPTDMAILRGCLGYGGAAVSDDDGHSRSVNRARSKSCSTTDKIFSISSLSLWKKRRVNVDTAAQAGLLRAFCTLSPGFILLIVDSSIRSNGIVLVIFFVTSTRFCCSTFPRV